MGEGDDSSCIVSLRSKNRANRRSVNSNSSDWWDLKFQYSMASLTAPITEYGSMEKKQKYLVSSISVNKTNKNRRTQWLPWKQSLRWALLLATLESKFERTGFPAIGARPWGVKMDPHGEVHRVSLCLHANKSVRMGTGCGVGAGPQVGVVGLNKWILSL